MNNRELYLEKEYEKIKEFEETKERSYSLMPLSWSDEEKDEGFRSIEKTFLEKFLFDLSTAEDLSKKDEKDLLKKVSVVSSKTFDELKNMLSFEKAKNKSLTLNPYTTSKEKLSESEKSLRDEIIGVCITRGNKERDIKEQTTELVSNYLVENFYIRSTRNDKQSNVYIYKEGIYLSDGRTYIKEFCKKVFKERFNDVYVNLVISKIEAMTYVDEEVFLNKQNDFPYLLPVRNGLLDLRNVQLLDFTPRIPFFTKLDVDYVPGQDCENVEGFIRSLVASEDDVKTLQEFFGYSLIKTNKFEKALMMLDSTRGEGSNGKTTLMVLFKNFLGLKNIASVSLSDLEEKEFTRIELHNKLVNIVPDLGQQSLSNTNVFRAFTGVGDPVMANRKFDSYVSFVNYAKFIYGTNKLPVVYEGIKAFFRRWVVVKFPYRFVGKKDFEYYQKLSREEGLDVSHIKKADKEVLNNLYGDEELSGFLNWCISGLQRLLKNEFFSNEKNTFEVELEWTLNSNSMAAFAMDCLDSDVDGVVTKKDLRYAYNQYCKKHGLNSVSDRMIKSHLQNEFGVSEIRPVTGMDGYRSNCWTGIVFRRGTVDGFGVSRITVDGNVVLDDSLFGKEKVVSGDSECVVELVEVGDWSGWFSENVSEEGFVFVDDFVERFGQSVLDEALDEGLLFEARPGKLRRLE